MPSNKMIKSRYFFEEEMIETLADVPAEPVPALPQDQPNRYIGQPVPRIDAYDKVSGSAVYTFDVRLPRMVHAATLRSPLPHARIRRIDTRRAEKLKGVLAVLTYQNAPQIPWYGKSFLFDPHLRYEGDEVACVAALTPNLAAEALKLIEVDYEELPFVLDAGEAMREDAPKLYDSGNLPDNDPSCYHRGDAEKGFAEADLVHEATFTTQVEVHNSTEPHCSVVNWDGDRLTVWDSTQGVFNVRDAVAGALEMPASRVRVITKYMGGGFGSKLEAGKYTVMAALLAREIGRPVRIALNRREMNLAVGNRPDSVQKLKFGVKRDGMLTAMRHQSRGAAGAHPRHATCSWPLRLMYACDNVETEEYSVLINAGRNRPFRAPGHVQGFFALESMMDIMAEKIGMDPLDFRLKNYAEIDQVYGIPYTSKLLREAYQKGAKAIGWQKRHPAGTDSGPVKRGMGMASQIWWGGGGPPAYATLKLSRDGSVQILCGTQDLGGGTYTYPAQIAAEVLEIPLESVQVVLGDTTACPFGPTSGGSQTAPSISPAVHAAAVKMKEMLISGAAAELELPESELKYADGEVFSGTQPEKRLKIEKIVRKMRERELTVTGARAANPRGYMISSFGVQFAEVEVDTETGQVRVLRVVAAHDIGRTLNRKLLENQFHGGIIQGIGFALLEQRVIDRNTGRVLTTNLHDYKLPTVAETPEIEVMIVSRGDERISSTGAKGIGEPATIPTSAAIANAVYNAIGKRITSLPITPDKVLQALHAE